MLLGYSSNGFQETTLSTALESIASRGFSGAELLLDTPHWKDSRQHKGQVDTILKSLESNQLRINNLNGNDSTLLGNNAEPEPRPIHPDESVRRAVLEWQQHLIDIAIDLGSPPLCFATGPLRAGQTEEEGREQLRRHIEPLVTKADKLKQPLSIEFEPDHFVHTWAGLKPYLEEFKSPYFGVNFDIGHAACVGEDIIIALKDAKDYVFNIHFEDIKNAVHIHLVPGKGDLPLKDVIAYLEEIQYDKGLTVELYNHSHRAEAAIDEVAAYFNEHHPHLLRK